MSRAAHCPESLTGVATALAATLLAPDMSVANPLWLRSVWFELAVALFNAENGAVVDALERLDGWACLPRAVPSRRDACTTSAYPGEPGGTHSNPP